MNIKIFLSLLDAKFDKEIGSSLGREFQDQYSRYASTGILALFGAL